MSAPKKKTYHCTGCGNTRGKVADRVDKDCCTCCRDEHGNRPGNGGTW